jgi:hypothetical protein
MISISLSYLYGLHLEHEGLGAYEHPLWVRLTEYGAVFLAAFRDGVSARRGADVLQV